MEFNIERTFTKSGIVTIVTRLESGKRININMHQSALDNMDEDELEYHLEQIINQYDSTHTTKGKVDNMLKVERCNQRIREKRRVKNLDSNITVVQSD